MSDKVIWMEGMVLSPHHFQQADILADASLNRRLRILSPFHYGLACWEIDRDALDNGFFSVKECAGVFPDGTPFDFPGHDTLLEPRPFEACFPAARETLGVYLAVAAQGAGIRDCAMAEAQGERARYLGQTREVADGNTGANPREIVFGRLNLRILFEGESPAGLQVLKVGELSRDSEGRVVPGDRFIPASVRIGASQALSARLKKLMEACLRKSNHLMAQRAQNSGGAARFNAETVTQYLLLSGINGALPGIMHFHRHPVAHPEALFRHLLGFAGSLASFGEDARAGDMPSYAHGDLEGCFHPLFDLLEALLGTTVPTGYRAFPLIRTSPLRFSADLRDAEFDNLGQFYLAVSAQAPETDILATVQRKSKLGPLSRMEMLVDAALPGIGLIPESRAPQAIPAKAGYKYFRLQQTGELWDQIVQARALAIHMPSDLPSTRLELLATAEMP